MRLKESFALLLKSQNSSKRVVRRLTHGASQVEISEDCMSGPDVLAKRKALSFSKIGFSTSVY
jgi:hypothetical protein